jgi:hypothetical protein
VCTGGFDNSAKNPNNPDPTARARWGPQSWNEMFMGFMDVADVPADEAKGESGAKAGARATGAGGGGR